MRRPRNISAKQLIRKLRRYGYEPTRQTGSHIRLTTETNGQHHITIPATKQLAIGKINAVLWEMVRHFGIPRPQLVKQLFG